MTNPFSKHITSGPAAVKRAYRILAKTCHPDVRSDKEAAAAEFRELTRIYEEALAQAKHKPIKFPKTPPDPPPRPAPPKPTLSIYRGVVERLEDWEFNHFGQADRVVRQPATLFEYGGTVQIVSRYSDYFQFEVPPKTQSGQRFRFKLPMGIVEIMLVREG